MIYGAAPEGLLTIMLRFRLVSAILLTVCTTLITSTGFAAEKGFKSLFNGKNLKGWEGDTEGYVVENKEIVCKPGGNIFTKDD